MMRIVKWHHARLARKRKHYSTHSEQQGWRELSGYLRFEGVDVPITEVVMNVNQIIVTATMTPTSPATLTGDFMWVDAGGKRMHEGHMNETVVVTASDTFQIVFQIDITVGHTFTPVESKTVWVLKKI